MNAIIQTLEIEWLDFSYFPFKDGTNMADVSGIVLKPNCNVDYIGGNSRQALRKNPLPRREVGWRALLTFKKEEVPVYFRDGVNIRHGNFSRQSTCEKLNRDMIAIEVTTFRAATVANWIETGDGDFTHRRTSVTKPIAPNSRANAATSCPK